MAFADVDVAAWPVVVVRFYHVQPTDDEASTYFSALAHILNDRATAATPCALVFDTSGVPMGRMFDVNMKFVRSHHEFNSLYKLRFDTVCRGFGVVVSNVLFRSLIKTALSFAPPTHPCNDFTSAAEAVAALR